MSNEVEDVSLEDVKRGLADGSIVLIDVREPNEWAAGHINGARLNPLSTFDVSAIPQEPGKKVVFHCRSGKRTLQAIARAHEAGRTDLNAHFGGSMLAWEAAGEPVER
ncbi:MAG: rhodanese-like domain-containing protein [Hyphomicrobiales bacterium]|nr:rhodanese-like domain-containing protein [Hyphomicrobiales bacterium]